MTEVTLTPVAIAQNGSMTVLSDRAITMTCETPPTVLVEVHWIFIGRSPEARKHYPHPGDAQWAVPGLDYIIAWEGELDGASIPDALQFQLEWSPHHVMGLLQKRWLKPEVCIPANPVPQARRGEVKWRTVCRLKVCGNIPESLQQIALPEK